MNEATMNKNTKEATMNLNETMNKNTKEETMSAEGVQQRLYAIGIAEENALFLAKDFVAWLAKQQVFSEQELKDWAVGQLLWEKDWPGPRSIWQEVTKGVETHEGKKTRWKIEKRNDGTPCRTFQIEWGNEFSLYQEFDLSLVAGLGKVAGVLASRKKRAGNSTVPGTSTGTGTTTSTSSTTTSTGTGTNTSSTTSELEKMKAENTSLHKEVESLRISQAKAYDRAKKEFSSLLEASAKREKSANEVAEKVKEQATGMDECIIKALSALNEAKSNQSKEKLLAIIQTAKDALAEAPKLQTGKIEKK